VIPARSGRRHVLHILHTMLSRPELPQSGATNLQDLLQNALQVKRRRSLVFIVSDFLSTPGWTEPLGQLAQRHEIVAVRLFDPLELELPDLGLVVVPDAETGEQLWMDTSGSMRATDVEPSRIAAAQAAARAFVADQPRHTRIGVVAFAGTVSVVQAPTQNRADVTRGEYFYASTATDLKKIYQALTARLVLETKETEITALFSAAAAILAFLAALLSLLWFNRTLEPSHVALASGGYRS